jgi:hypothetical protein
LLREARSRSKEGGDKLGFAPPEASPPPGKRFVNQGCLFWDATAQAGACRTVEEGMNKVQTRSSGDIVPFPGEASRTTRRPLAADEARGVVVLFTGVRYDRQPELPPDAFGPLATQGSPRRRRRRS